MFAEMMRWCEVLWYLDGDEGEDMVVSRVVLGVDLGTAVEGENR